MNITLKLVYTNSPFKKAYLHVFPVMNSMKPAQRFLPMLVMDSKNPVILVSGGSKGVCNKL